MRSIKIAGALFVVLAVIGVALAGAASPPSAPSPLLVKELAVLTNQGIAPARAMRAIEVQGRVASTNLVSDVEAATGENFAGTWFDPATAMLHIGASSAASRRAVERVIARAGLSADAVVTPVRSTMAELVSTQKRWDRKLVSLFEREQVRTGLEPQRNGVSVTLSASVPPARRVALEREAAASAVNVFVTVAPGDIGFAPQATTKCKTWVRNKGYCNPSLTSGVTLLISKKPECTAGPLAINKNGERVVLTAGHCITVVGEKWSAINTAEVESVVGPVEAVRNGSGEAGKELGDFGSIIIEPAWQTGKPVTPVFAATAEWKKMNAKKEETSYPIKGERKPEVGNTNCHVGQTSGESCAEIRMLNVVWVSAKRWYEGLVEDTGPELIGEGGDSGGPWLFVEANQEVLMEGTHSGWDFECKKVALGPNLYKTEKECREEVNGAGEGEWEQVKYTCTEVALEKEGANFFSSELNCKERQEAGKGKWERKPQQHLVWEPLKQPVGGAPQGSLEALGLELLTKTNETMASSLLPEKATFAFKSAAGENTRLETLGGKKIECKKVTGSGELVAARLGVLELKMAECEEPSLKVKCTGLSDTTGNITIKGAEFHLRHLLPTSEGVNFLILVGSVHFSCTIVLFTVSGCIASMDILTKSAGESAVNKLLASLFVNFLQEKGDAKPTSVATDNALAMEGCELKVKEGSGANESAGQLGSGTIETCKAAGLECTFLIDLSGTL